MGILFTIKFIFTYNDIGGRNLFLPKNLRCLSALYKFIYILKKFHTSITFFLWKTLTNFLL